MTSVPAASAIMIKPIPSYNGVKIRVNNPVVNTIGDNKDNCNYNAVDIEVNNPKVTSVTKPIYVYPKSKGIITYDKTGLVPVNMPHIPVTPVAYTTINNKTLINAEIAKVPAEEKQEKPVVPEPNVTTVEAEKNPSFHGLDNVEIISPEKIKPEVDINTVIAKLADKNFDVQAVQLKEIAETAMKEPVKAIPYIVTDVYSGLIDIINADTSALAKPSEQQLETRKKIILNELIKEQARKSGQDPKTVELPFSLTKEELQAAVELSPFELAERNKEYAIITTALLTKIYADETQKETGMVVPLTDLPGVSDFVNIIRNSKNTDTKLSAIEALVYIKRPEYKEELKAILELTANDKNPVVSEYAQKAMEYIDK